MGRFSPRVRIASAALLLVVGASAARAGGPPPSGKAWADQPPDETIKEVVASLDASSIARIPLDKYALFGLDGLADRERCLGRKGRGDVLELSCGDEVLAAAWPPKTTTEVARLLTNAVRLVDERRTVKYERVKAVVRALANAVGDPYTGYLPPELVAKGSTTSFAMNGTAGIELEPRDPTRVRAVSPLSDAEKEGLAEGDRIVSVDGVPAKDLTYTELSLQLLGPVDSVVRLVVDGARGRRKLVVNRHAAMESEPSVHELEGGVLYVRLPAWTPGVARRVAAALWENRAAGVVLDLRHNGGGRMEEAVALSDLFLRDGRIAGVRAGQGRPSHDWTAAREANDVTSPLVVLIDGGSGSASELFAMVVKERERGMILGAQSLGKGSVQELIKLPDGGFLKVTVGYYVGPSGKRLDDAGVRPNRFLSRPQGRTVLQGARPEEDAWVLSALDVLTGARLRADSGARPFGPMP